MPRVAFRRVPVQQAAQQLFETKTFIAPTRGWVANENLAASQSGGAYVLENWFPTQNSIRLRGGSELFATIGENPVTALFTYKSGSTESFFAADATDIYDITSPSDPETPPTADVSSQTGGYYSTAHFTTAAGDFIYVVNGEDLALLYDGSTWTPIDDMSSPAIDAIATSTFSHVNVYRSRLYFVEVGTLSVWYLPVDALGGTAVEMTLLGIFQRGGSILFTGTWSLDAGDGVDDKFVVVTTEGEVAAYEGSYPGGTDWSLVGRYDISKPLGKNAHIKAGGDIVIATEDGAIPLSSVITKDPAALSLDAVTRQIEPEWHKEVLNRGASLPWDMIKWTKYNQMIVALPTQGSLLPYCFIVNVETGAACKYTGWDTRCLGIFGEWAYFGTSAGTIMKCETGGSDNGAPYECTAVLNFDHLGRPGTTKLVQQARSVFLASRPFRAKVSVSKDYVVSLPAPPPAELSVASGDEWDTGLWDAATWDAAGVKSVSTKWVSIGRNGFVIAPQVQVTCGDTFVPDAELVSLEVTYGSGGVVV